MKVKGRIVAVVLASLFLMPAITHAKKNNVKVNTKKSKLEWLGKKVTGEHSGTIELKEGMLVLEGNAIKEGRFVVDMSSIKNTDIENPEYKAKLERHLKSDDFFGVSNHPESIFVITESSKMKDGNYKVKGNMTIKEITQPIEFMVNLHHHDDAVHVSGKITVDRSKFDVRYGSGSFFDNLGDKTIYDDFELNLDLYLE